VETGSEAPAASGSGRADLLRSLAVVAVGLIAYFAIPFRGRHWPVAVALGVLAIGAAVPITRRRVGRIRRSDQPVLEAVGAVALLATLVLLTFAVAYYAIATNTDQIPGIETKVDSLYFTVSTVATVGYGDIVPTGQAARAIVTLQIIANLTLIAGAFRIVTGAAHERQVERRSAPEA
jgi:voltage-gated potassium channel Kch